MGQLTEKIMKVMKIRNVKSISDVQKALLSLEDEIISEAVRNEIDNLIIYIEKQHPDSLDIYIKLKNMLEER